MKIEHLVYRSLLCFEELARAINWLENTICWPYVGEYWIIYLVKVNDFKKIKFWKMVNLRNKYFTEIK